MKHLNLYIAGIVTLIAVMVFVAFFEIDWQWPETRHRVVTEHRDDCAAHVMAAYEKQLEEYKLWERDPDAWHELKGHTSTAMLISQPGKPNIIEFKLLAEDKKARYCAIEHPSWAESYIRWRWPDVDLRKS